MQHPLVSFQSNLGEIKTPIGSKSYGISEETIFIYFLSECSLEIESLYDEVRVKCMILRNSGNLKFRTGFRKFRGRRWIIKVCDFLWKLILTKLILKIENVNKNFYCEMSFFFFAHLNQKCVALIWIVCQKRGRRDKVGYLR